MKKVIHTLIEMNFNFRFIMWFKHLIIKEIKVERETIL